MMRLTARGWRRFRDAPATLRGRQLLIAGALVGIATILRAVLDPLVGNGVPFIAFFPAITIATAWSGVFSGIAALALASLVIAYAWLQPVWHLSLHASSEIALLMFWVACGILIAIAAVFRNLLAAVRESDRRATLVAHEMQHRVRNVLSIVQALSAQTARTARTVPEYQAAFEGRLHALALAQDMLRDSPDRPLDLQALLGRILAPFGPERFRLTGPAIQVPGDLGPLLCLALHELGTNALKYGALSAAAGQVALTWTCQDGGATLDWKELAGPPVAPPASTGSGTRLLTALFRGDSRQAALAFEPDGLHAVLRFECLRPDPAARPLPPHPLATEALGGPG